MVDRTISALDPATALTGAELIVVVQGGVTKRTTVTDFAGALGSSTLKVGTTAYAGIGIAGYGGTTFVVAPNGVTGRFAISDTSLELHSDNIVRGRVVTKTVTISNSAPATFSAAAHGIPIGSEIAFTTTGVLPAPLTANTVYYVGNSSYTANSFRVSTTYAGSPLTTTSVGSGVHTAKALTQTPGITFKVPDYNNAYTGFDHALMNAGVSESIGPYPYTFQFQGGLAGGAGTPGIGWLVLTTNTVGVAIPRIHTTGGDDNTSVGIGVFGASSEVQGTFMQLHADSGGKGAHTHYTTGSTGNSGTDGASVGVWTSNQLRIWNYENTPVIIGANNQEIIKIESGVAPYLNIAPNGEFRVNNQKIIGIRGASIPNATGGTTIDTQARAAINALLTRLRATTGHGLIDD
jgi:hypothetical protein